LRPAAEVDQQQVGFAGVEHQLRRQRTAGILDRRESR
jgi:hypothetical protein